MYWLPHLERGAIHNPGMCLDWELNQQPFALWDDTQPTEPHQSGKDFFNLINTLPLSPRGKSFVPQVPKTLPCAWCHNGLWALSDGSASPAHEHIPTGSEACKIRVLELTC